jgi:aminoglycoside phosphotransferase (APT) family kinase protein
MHPDEIDIDVTLVRGLITAQFPEWAHLSLEPVPSAGTDNAMFRLGDSRAVRLPRVGGCAAQVEKEQRWLPMLSLHVPLAIPVPLAIGSPGNGYPWHWSVYEWLDGQDVIAKPLSDLNTAAWDLANFITALRRIDATGGPLPGTHNSHRGVALAERDDRTRAEIVRLGDAFDSSTLTQIWEEALHASVWDGPPSWIHGDLQGGNLLARGGRLSAVIDFGCLSTGDPACDLQAAWNFFEPESRHIFRSALQVDDAAWDRGRGWALSVAVIALPYYERTNPILASISRYALDQLIADYRRRLKTSGKPKRVTAG